MSDRQNLKYKIPSLIKTTALGLALTMPTLSLANNFSFLIDEKGERLTHHFHTCSGWGEQINLSLSYLIPEKMAMTSVKTKDVTSSVKTKRVQNLYNETRSAFTISVINDKQRNYRTPDADIHYETQISNILNVTFKGIQIDIKDIEISNPIGTVASFNNNQEKCFTI